MSKALPAQVVHAGLWTGYLDGIGISSMVQMDTFLYIKTANGTAFVNTQTRQTRFFYEMGNPDLPINVDLRVSTVDKQGNLWTFINSQLVKITPGGSIAYVGGMPEYQVLVLRVDHAGQIWAGMVTEPLNNPATTRCLAKFTGIAWESIDFGQIRMNIRDIRFDSLNQPILIANSAFNTSGIFQYNGTNFVKIPDSPASFQLSLSSDGQIASCGNKSISTLLKVYKNGSWINYGPGFSCPHFDANNVLWVCNSVGSVYTLENGTLIPQLSPPSNYRTGPYDPLLIYGFELDYQGNMWLGKRTGLFSASVTDLQEWDFVPTSELLCPESPNSIAAFHDTIWLANDAGVTRIINGFWEKLDYPANKRPFLFYDSLRQGLWVGANGPLLDFYQGPNHSHIDIDPTVDNSNYPYIDAITLDQKGNLWIKTPKALSRLDLSGNWYSFNCGDEFSTYFIIGGIYPKGDFMYVTVGGSYPWLPNEPHKNLYKIDGDMVINVDIPEALLLEVNNFALVSEQDIWFTASGSSQIIHYMNGQTQAYTDTDLGGTLGSSSIVLYNDSTLLVCSNNQGLDVFKQGQWYHPTIPSNRIANSHVSCWHVSDDHKLYMGQSALLVLEDINALLDQLGQPISVNPEIELSALAYPNPTLNFLNLDKIITAFGPDLSAFLYNAYGQQVKAIAAPLPNVLDLSQQPAGIYFLSIKSANHPIPKSLKIIKK
ncbi:MAG: T9SS type A sorting domain-containing protein [Lewinellaceae bacterium]|nr:T9SS type A sorting domain-containing protein [Lewinellaceae bacterium]